MIDSWVLLAIWQVSALLAGRYCTDGSAHIRYSLPLFCATGGSGDVLFIFVWFIPMRLLDLHSWTVLHYNISTGFFYVCCMLISILLVIWVISVYFLFVFIDSWFGFFWGGVLLVLFSNVHVSINLIELLGLLTIHCLVLVTSFNG